MKYIKSPFNYIGGKYRLLPQIIPHFPKHTNTFVDVMGGGFNVGLNVDADKIIYNDMVTPLAELWQYFYNHNKNEILQYITETIQQKHLSKTDKDAFNNFREHYNTSQSKNPLDLYILMCYSYNYQLRYNNKGEYNSSHGTNRSSFTEAMKEKLVQTLDAIHKKNITFRNDDFQRLINENMQKLDNCSLVYFDPPYIISTGNYNDGNRGFKNWTNNDERRLYKTLNTLNENNINFALSNITHHKNKENKYLLKFIENNSYNIHQVNSNYNNCSYNSSKSMTKEVLITNYI